MSKDLHSGRDNVDAGRFLGTEPDWPFPQGAALLDDLAERGLIADSTDIDALRSSMDAGPITLYCGFDPTADSLHVGNLQALLLLRRFQLAGHTPIALVGGATGRIGDPGGRDSERPLLSDEEIDHNVEQIRLQYQRFLDFSKPAHLVDNREWTGDLGLIDFLRDVGKYSSVNVMMARDSVKNRLGRDGGLSFTEFSYQLLQAHDYRVLHERFGCVLQVAGSDQWGNITAGTELIRKTRGETAHGLTSPLLVDSEGRKFGKSTGGGQLWLDAEKTSPYQLFQYFMHTTDDMIEISLLRLTLLSVEECREIAAQHAKNPGARLGQRRLAHELLKIVHGEESAELAAQATDLLFGGGDATPTDDVWSILVAEVPHIAIAGDDDDDLAGIAVRGGLVKSKGEVRRNPQGLRLDGQQIDPTQRLAETDFRAGEFALMRWGKAKYLVIQRN